ncbi:hypothetical protein DUU50_12020 [Salmonella enterica subsp. enterica serovar Corvallis]|jgi:hypothetical protein|uniref:hypothetical protein n=1 Tax=Salmonella enterica TaxID=28901 RepID=UPI000FB89E0A|nr:hypothetical protein [Salmonella enterica]EAA6139644.1 hypothetical protein [Salmonella enterica subsp. enterica serovar Corvallis]EEB0499218.1 hypothetical protein [Salmonella enterica subsp. enterica serovar Javiana]EED7523236.1 hypothetical protein [Salmonella enterica subsp. enterica serovar Blockley]EAA6790979.1 hypothetical protein [Salmonella enterica subsp. enterica serovar Corvallis]EAA6822089.1 hypothetical protein [Salmonella enterica subsp. enterica serovar Corvallis]
MKNQTGGPAFPELGNVGCNSDWQSESGMTLRDYFAAKAMQAMISNPSIIDNDSECAVNYAASASYKFADAMLKAREEV